jgi:osmotically-inducible protein OsmY
MSEEKSSWMGPKGFDEARYYKDDESEIDPHQTDDRILAVAEEAIARNDSIEDMQISVHVKDGIVTLKGLADSREEILEIEKSVVELTGVKEVRNEINLKDH